MVDGSGVALRSGSDKDDDDVPVPSELSESSDVLLSSDDDEGGGGRLLSVSGGSAGVALGFGAAVSAAADLVLSF